MTRKNMSQSKRSPSPLETQRAHANELSRSVIDALGEGVVGMDDDLRITFVNPEAERQLGWKEDDLVGKVVCEVVHDCLIDPDGNEASCPLRRVMIERQPLQVEETRFAHSNGAVFPVSFIASAIVENDAVRGIALSFQDITRRKQAEEVLNRHMTELARLNAELDEFTYVASHDLLEPVRKLVAFSEWLKKDLGDGLPPRAEQDLAFITDAAQRMQRLVGDLLTLSRTGKVSMVRETVSLDDAINRALEVLELRIAENGATISRTPLPMVWGDLTLLAQLYQNLIGNALKFTDGAHPEIALTAEQVGGEWIFGVRDNGIGIPAQYADQVFQPFKRLHGRGQFEGSGVGLSICRKVVERHHGRIWVESNRVLKNAHIFPLTRLRS
jgi:PAS domain S-box-containing protein